MLMKFYALYISKWYKDLKWIWLEFAFILAIIRFM